MYQSLFPKKFIYLEIKQNCGVHDHFAAATSEEKLTLFIYIVLKHQILSFELFQFSP